MIARAAGLDRSDIAKQVSRWEAAGLCEVKASGVRQRFALLKVSSSLARVKIPPPNDILQPFPRAQKSRDAIAVRLFEQLEEREEADVVRLFGVCDFIASKGCAFPLSLSVILYCERDDPLEPTSSISTESSNGNLT